MTQKKHRISPEDIDLKEVRIGLDRYSVKGLRAIKSQIERANRICGSCASWCGICNTIFPEAYGCDNKTHGCPCYIYLKKDVAHVVEYLLLNLKI